MKPRSVSHHRVAVRPEDFPRDGRPELAVMGRSNVGKSSLLNAFFGRSGMARVSKTPGRTRELHFYLVDERYYLVDLPGFGYAKVSKSERQRFAKLVEAYLDRGEALRLAVQLVDIRHDPTPLDEVMRAGIVARGLPSVVVLTKGDKVSGSAAGRARARARRLLELDEKTPVLVTSSQTGRGVPELRKILIEALADDEPRLEDAELRA